MDREVGTLPRAVNGEVAERHDPQFIEVRISRAEKLAANFRRRVRAQRLREMFFFRKRNFLRRAINRRARSEDESLHSTRPRPFQQMQRARDIGVVVKLRLLNRWTNARARGHVRDRV